MVAFEVYGLRFYALAAQDHLARERLAMQEAWLCERQKSVSAMLEGIKDIGDARKADLAGAIDAKMDEMEAKKRKV